MAGAWYRARAELRRRWLSTLGLALLAGLVGGVVLAGAAGARRTSSAMDRFAAFNRAGDLLPIVVAMAAALLVVAAAVAAVPARSAAATELALVLRSE